MRRSSKIATFLILLSGFIAASVCRPHPRQRSDRESFGDVRATIMESLLQSLFSGAQFRWAPDLQLRTSDGFSRAHFPGLTLSVAPDGSMSGASGLELTSNKEQAIFSSEQLRQTDPSHLATKVVVFRANSKGHVEQSQQFELDPTDPLAEIKMVHTSNWPLSGWPILRIEYVSHIPSQNSYTRIEWGASFDVNASKIISRLPAGISKKSRSGEEVMYIFSIARSGPGVLQITDRLTKKSIPYQCSDPCVVDGARLLAQWSD